MKEVQAADPNVTFLDDDSITYKDLAARRIRAGHQGGDPSTLPRRGSRTDHRPASAGSSVSVSQVTNSPARMAELQAAQQEALATYEKGLGSTGSSTPPSLEPLPVRTDQFHSD